MRSLRRSSSSGHTARASPCPQVPLPLLLLQLGTGPPCGSAALLSWLLGFARRPSPISPDPAVALPAGAWSPPCQEPLDLMVPGRRHPARSRSSGPYCPRSWGRFPVLSLRCPQDGAFTPSGLCPSCVDLVHCSCAEPAVPSAVPLLPGTHAGLCLLCVSPRHSPTPKRTRLHCLCESPVSGHECGVNCRVVSVQ